MPKYMNTDDMIRFSEKAKAAGLDYIPDNFNLDPNGTHVAVEDTAETLKRSSGIWISAKYLVKLTDDINIHVASLHLEMNDYLDLESEDVDTVEPEPIPG